jgi:hypothetical protein
MGWCCSDQQRPRQTQQNQRYDERCDKFGGMTHIKPLWQLYAG